jgi:hypothetical protein
VTLVAVDGAEGNLRNLWISFVRRLVQAPLHC